MRATIKNISPLPREGTVLVTFPKSVEQYPTESSFKTDDGRVFRAVVGRSTNLRYTPVRIHGTFAGSETVKGDLQPTPAQSYPIPYQWHKWVSDNIIDTIPILKAKRNGIVKTSVPQDLVLIESSDMHQRWFMRSVIKDYGLIFEYWADIHHNDPEIKFSSKIVWSDRNDPEVSTVFESIDLECGEFINIDFYTTLGTQFPVKSGKIWKTQIAKDISLKDASGLPVTGTILAYISSDNPPVSDPEVDDKDYKSLIAGLLGPITGCYDEWDGEWLSTINAPRVGHNESNRKFQAFLDGLKTNKGWFAQRPMAIGESPGQTGEQDDFGSTKGIDVVTHKDPRLIFEYKYCVLTDLFRGFMHYDIKDQKILPINEADHPRWVTWSGETHYHSGVSPDRLGKATGPDPFSPFWHGYDDQHRSQNLLAAYLQLTDDPLALDIISHHTTTDLASYRMRYPQYGAGAARAQGRMMQAWANFYVLVPIHMRPNIKRLLDSKWTGMYDNNSFNTTKPVKVIGTNGPDGRKPIYDDAGNLLPTWSIWEHALAAVGLYNAIKVDQTHSRSEQLLITYFENFVKYGCFKENDTWYLVYDAWYNNGDEIPDWEHTACNKINYGGAGNVGKWVLAGMIAAAEFLPSGPLKDKAKECANFFTNRQEATTDSHAEWWCVARSVAF